MYYDIVFHFDGADGELKKAIGNANNYFNGLPDKTFTAVLLVNGPGVLLMGKDGEYAQALEDLHARGLKIRVCNNAMSAHSLAPEWLTPACRIVPAGLLELVDLQRKGFVYVKP